jgi:metal-responsive CopG/Arc/MetJ family transcriptional regulator
MRRVSVFVSDKLLDEVNEEAKKQRISRSALINAVLEKYIEARRSERDHRAKVNKMREAAHKMDALAEKLGEWNPYVTIRKFRDSNRNDDF